MERKQELEARLNKLDAERQEVIEELAGTSKAEDVNLLRILLDEVRRLRGLEVAVLVDLSEKIKKDNRYAPDSELADMGFFCRELESVFDDMRKDAKARKELIGKVLCLHALTDAGSDVIQGQFARAECDIKMEPVLPKKGTPEYRRLLEHFGVDDVAIEKGLLSVHWNWMKEYLTELARQGKKSPEGVLATNPSHYAKFVRKSSN